MTVQTYSVVIPAYNAAETLGESIESVLSQSIGPTEVIVVDDGSTDNTGELANTYGGVVRVIHQQNSGPGAATTNGIRQSSEAIVALLDSDDIWLPQKMERQLAVLAERPEISLMASRMRSFRHGEPVSSDSRERIGLIRSTLVLRRSVFDAVGEIVDPPGFRGELIDWIARFREAGHGELELPEVLALRRIIPGSLSYGRDAKRDLGYLKVAHLAMQRRKARQGDNEKDK